MVIDNRIRQNAKRISGFEQPQRKIQILHIASQFLIEEAAAAGSGAVQQAITEGDSFAETCALILINSLTLLEQNQQIRQVTELTLFKTGLDPDLLALEQTRQ